MTARTVLVVYGNSVFLAALKVEIDQCGLELCTIEAGCPDAVQRIMALHPNVVLFDLCADHPDFTIPLLRERPSLVLAGVDPGNEQILLVTGQCTAVHTIGGLLELMGLTANDPDL